MTRIVKGTVRTRKVGSAVEFELEVDDSDSDDDIEQLAREAMFDRIEWDYTVEEKQL